MKPRLLDLFCGAGGAAVGLHRAGFDVTGVDIKPQPHYPFPFLLADALAVPLDGYDAYWASPPCQYYSRLRHLPWLRKRVYWRSIPPTRVRLMTTGKPWILENVEDAGWDMPDSIILCGQMFGVPLIRHRRFETWPFLTLQPPHERHKGVIAPGRASLSKRHSGQQGYKEINRESVCGHSGCKGDAERRRLVMGIDWMNRDELTQAIPPVYAEYMGRAMLRAMGL